MAEPDNDVQTFDQALARLDDVVRRLEGGEVGLEEAVTLFETGQQYLGICRERLAAAEARIEELTASDLPSSGDTANDGPLTTG